MLKEYAIVRVVKLIRPIDDYKGWSGNKRPPHIGDIGTVVEVLHGPNLPLRYVVESVESDGTTIWLSDFEPGEIALDPEYEISEKYEKRLKYIRVKWLHNIPTEPTELYYEIKEDDWTIRGIFVFADGSMENVGQGLYEAPIPPLEEINAMPDFEGMEISKDEFEIVWKKLLEING